MPLSIPDELTKAIRNVRADDLPLRWLVAGYDGSKALKLISTGTGDFKELVDAIAVDDQVQYGIINSPNGIVMGHVQWSGENVNGMKKSYVMRNLQQTNALFGYCHHHFKGFEQSQLDKEMTENGEFTGERTIGAMEGWNPNLEDWEQMWEETNPLNGFNPGTQWIYRWDPTGDIKMAQLPEDSLPRLRKLHERTQRIPKSIVPPEFQEKLKKIQSSKQDEDLPPMSVDDMIMAARCEAVIDILEGRQPDPAKLNSSPVPSPRSPRKFKKFSPTPESGPEKPKKKFAPVPAPADPPASPKTPERKIKPVPVPEPEEVVPEPEPEPAPAEEKNRYVIYTSALAKPKLVEKVKMIYNILDIYDIPYEEVDVYVDGCLGGDKGKQMRESSGSRELPQIWINGEYLKGGVKEFKRRSESGDL